MALINFVHKPLFLIRIANVLFVGHIPKCSHSFLSTFQKEHIPKSAHSILSPFQKGHTLCWLYVFQKGHILSWAHFKNGKFCFEHIPIWAHSKRAHSHLSSFQKEHIPKRAHSKKEHIPNKAHFILITFQKGLSRFWAERTHSKKSTFEKGTFKKAHSKRHILFWAHSKPCTFHFYHITKKAHSILSAFQKGIKINPYDEKTWHLRFIILYQRDYM